MTCPNGYQNGRIPLRVLVPVPAIGGQTAYLTADAARGFWGVGRASGITPRLNGPNSGNRRYEVQVLFWRTMPRGRAAYPGTSNHGCARAGDCDPPTIRAMRSHGSTYGWAKTEAFSEPWHWCFTGPTAASRRVRLPVSWPTLRIGDRRGEVYRAQTYLYHKGYFKARRSSTFGPLTRAAVRRFQKDHHLTADGVIGPRTWALLRRRTTTK